VGTCNCNATFTFNLIEFEEEFLSKKFIVKLLFFYCVWHFIVGYFQLEEKLKDENKVYSYLTYPQQIILGLLLFQILNQN
jgi:hypothetical protein